MRITLATMTLLGFLSIACSVISSSGLSNGGTTPRRDAGGTTTGGSPPGAVCASNDACGSGICGLAGAGNCCTRACAATDQTCGASGCDDGGACIYPVAGLDCGPTSCSDDAQAQPQCDGFGSCSAESLMLCPFDATCNDAGTACSSRCSSSAECLKGFSCNNGLCVVPQQLGPCTEKDDCLSGICGINGTGHCCNSACLQGAPCGATDCDSSTGACNYAANTVTCGQASCDGGVFESPACNGVGRCEGSIISACQPFACGASGCLTTCSSNADCNGGYCDLPSSTCCGLASGGQMAVDAASGSDTQICCGGQSSPCLTLTHALHLIDEAQATDVEITATYNRTESGFWAPPGETYPIVLGWGAELTAYGIAFYDGDGGNRALFEIGAVSPNDHVGYASIVGGALGGAGQPPSDQSTILIDPGNTLYIASALVYSSLADQTTAIEVSAGARLTLGQDHSGGQTGTVFVGDNSPSPLFDGYNGIVCDSANGLGCTITDALVGVTNSVSIAAQANHDIDAEDFAVIALLYGPQIGIRPMGAGRATCVGYEDGSLSKDAAVLIHGKANVTMNGGAVQCIGGTAIALEGSANGVPSLSLDGMTIEDATVGLHAWAGKAAIASCNIEYNTIGVEQDTDGTNIASIDLSGGGGGTTTVACNTSGDGGMIGVSVLNLTTQVLDADDVDWDTTGPDVFSCDASLMTCTCAIPSCTDSAGADGMDAVMESTGMIETTGNGSAPTCVN